MRGTGYRVGWMIVLGLGGLLASGCVSADRYVYESTPSRSATVRVVDAFTQDTLWSKNVPAEHRLIIRLKRTGEPMAMRVTGQPATSLSWALYESPNTSINEGMWRNHVADGSVALDGRPIRLRVDYDMPADLSAREDKVDDPVVVPEAWDAQPAPAQPDEPGNEQAPVQEDAAGDELARGGN